MPDLSLSVVTLPEDLPYPAKVRELAFLLAQAFLIDGATNLKGVVIQTTSPGVEDQDKMWVKTNASGYPIGVYTYSGGWNPLLLCTHYVAAASKPSGVAGSLCVESDNKRIVFHDGTNWVVPRSPATVFNVADNTLQAVTGIQSKVVISSWTVEDLPAGDVCIDLAVAGSLGNASADAGGTVFLYAGETELDYVATHSVKALAVGYYTMLHLRGYVNDFVGGDLVVSVKVDGEGANFDIDFGISNQDARFGRRARLISGL